jgi:alpha-tubulin suppressor-like RCC1 family protein
MKKINETRNFLDILGCKGMGIGIVSVVLGILVMASVATATSSSGDVWAWGYNGYGQLGDGTTTQRSTPVQVSGITDIIDIAGGLYHTIALKSDGTVWAWGWNEHVQLGDGTTTQRSTPVQVSGITDVIDIAGGTYHTIALKSDGTVWTWGSNYYGQLGDGTTTQRMTPVQVNGITDITEIASGNQHSIALKLDGTVWTWGYNYNGQLGDGTTTTRLIPVQVSGLKDVTEIASWSTHTIALKSDGTVWAWGNNVYGQLGDGTTSQRLTPVQVSGITNVIDIAGGTFHTIALKSDGTVWAWGNNGYGQLGDGTITQQTKTPVQVSGLKDVTEIAGGVYHTIALKSDGTVWTCGDNTYGQLGDGTTTQSLTPVQVSGLKDVTEIAGGAYQTIALASKSPPSDTEAPVITVPEDVTKEATGANTLADLGTATATDLVDPSPVITSNGPATFPVGTTDVIWTATDASGNKATATQQVTVVDTTKPTITAHADINAEAASSAGAVVTYTSPATSDAVDGPGTSTCAPASGSTFVLGDTTVTCSATDAHGNAATSTSFKITVQDTNAPLIADHAYITAEAISASGAAVSYTSPATSDAVDGPGTSTCSPVSGSTFVLGETTVTCSATDAHGNSASTTFKITVQYTFSGLLQPIDPDGKSLFKLGSTIPVKFQLTYAGGSVTNAIASIHVAQISNNLVGSDIEAISTAAATTGNLFRYDSTSNLYIFNLATKSLSKGTYKISIDLGDGNYPLGTYQKQLISLN